MNTWAWPVNRDPYYIAFSSFVGGRIGRSLIRRHNFFAKTIMPLTFGDRHTLSVAVHAHYLRPLHAPEDRTGCLVFPRQILEATPWLSRLWGKISTLRGTPTLIVWGMKDIAFRKKELRRWEGVFPDARTIRLSSVGHFVQEEAPGALADAVLSFLQETTPEGARQPGIGALELPLTVRREVRTVGETRLE